MWIAFTRNDPAHRLTEGFGRERFLDALGHPGAHRLEHQPRIEGRRDQDDAAARVLFADRAEVGRQLLSALARRRRVRRAAGLVRGRARRAESRGP